MDNRHPIYAFAGRRLLLRREGEGLRVPLRQELEGLVEMGGAHEVLMNSGREVWAVAVDEATASPTLALASVATSFALTSGRVALAPVSTSTTAASPALALTSDVATSTSALSHNPETPTPQPTPAPQCGRTGVGAPWTWVDLRQSYYCLPLDDYLAAGKASEILYWDSHSRFCPACGTPTRRSTPIMKLCPACGMELYPPVATAIIVLIQRGDEVLLVRARNFRGTHYGLVAGFLEAGETLEECVRREVREETTLEISDIRYFGSQPWPYPCGLMVGFTARYVSGNLRLQEEELTTAAFFRRDNLPELPQQLSIARRLIDWWVSREGMV